MEIVIVVVEETNKIEVVEVVATQEIVQGYKSDLSN